MHCETSEHELRFLGITFEKGFLEAWNSLTVLRGAFMAIIVWVPDLG